MRKKKLKCDVCIIGAGSGGLSIAAGAVQMGAKVVLIERDKMGGDCLNTGCVPSKAAIAAATAAHTAKRAKQFGVEVTDVKADYQKLYQHIHSVIAAIAPNDSVERFEGLGVTVIKGEGKFLTKNKVEAAGYKIKARRIVIATGSRAKNPPIPGLEQVNTLSNETIFDLQEKPEHLLIIGGGPIGCEMAQTHCRLGVKVSVLDVSTLLPKDDAELVAVVREQLIDDGVDIYEKIKITRVEKTGSHINVLIEVNGEQKVLSASHILVSAGRQVNTENLALDKAGVEFDARGIKTNQKLRSVSNRKVYAVGDVAGSYQFTHAAAYHAGIVIRNILFALPAKVNYTAMPWATYVEPELANVGLQEQVATEKDIQHKVLKFPFADNDRAQAERATEGLIKVIVSPKGVVLGCGIVGAHAGELILPWVLAVQQKMKIGAIANIIAPYPTLSEISKRVAGSYYTDALFSPKVRRFVRFVQRFIP